MRVLITGLGYIGCVLTRFLQGHEIIAIDNLMYGQEKSLLSISDSLFEFHNHDVRDHSFVNKIASKCDVIIPLAAIVGAPACDKNPNLATEVNVNSIYHLVKSLSSNQIIIMPNTNSAYGKCDTICTEDTPFNPISLYSKTKCEAEKIVIDKQNSIVLRLATVYGSSPRMRLDLMVNNFSYLAFFNGCLEIFEGNFRRNFIHVKDVARCFVHCIENFNTMKNEVYNLGLDSANMTKKQLAEKISNHINCKITMADGEDKDKRDYLVSSKKLYKTGFVPQYDLDCGIEELKRFFSILKTYPNKEEIEKMKND